MLNALGNAVPSHLLDHQLFDFKNLLHEEIRRSRSGAGTGVVRHEVRRTRFQRILPEPSPSTRRWFVSPASSTSSLNRSDSRHGPRMRRSTLHANCRRINVEEGGATVLRQRREAPTLSLLRRRETLARAARNALHRRQDHRRLAANSSRLEKKRDQFAVTEVKSIDGAFFDWLDTLRISLDLSEPGGQLLPRKRCWNEKSRSRIGTKSSKACVRYARRRDSKKAGSAKERGFSYRLRFITRVWWSNTWSAGRTSTADARWQDA